MSNMTLVVAIVVLLLALLAMRMPVAFALGFSGAVGLALLRDFSFASNMLGSIPFDETARFTLTIIPMFILMGMFAMKAKMAEQVYAIAAHVFAKLPGGLGVATVMACAGFAAVSGSSIGTTATMSKLSVGEMRKHGYPDSLATATVAMAGTLGVLIPPSIILVLYAIMTGESVAKVLAAGILPGILTAIAFAIFIMVIAPKQVAKQKELNQALAVAAGTTPALSGSGGTATLTAVKQIAPTAPTRLRDLPMRGLIRVGILFFIVLGGMYSGLFTPTESAAVGALAA
ncbi:MAG: TRAP transporter large permease subunit, partial [Ruaniaceae bacterium]|nr:TRAP transporter large permease subunit [Ruaniaceae bacterium]